MCWAAMRFVVFLGMAAATSASGTGSMEEKLALMEARLRSHEEVVAGLASSMEVKLRAQDEIIAALLARRDGASGRVMAGCRSPRGANPGRSPDATRDE